MSHSQPTVIPSFIPRELYDEVFGLLLAPRGRYLACKLVQREQGVSLKQAKQLVARIGDFTWSDPMPSKR